MTAEYVAESMAPETFGFDGITAEWLADRLDEHGVVPLRGVIPDQWLTAMRESVLERIATHGDGDLYIAGADGQTGSPAHRLMSDPVMRTLFHDTARLRTPGGAPVRKVSCNVPVRNGFGPKFPANLFHYDPTVLTVIIPLFIPHATVGHCGELAAFGNTRPFRRSAAIHLVETFLTHNAPYRRHLARKVDADPASYLVDLRPGDAYAFWGYRQFHGNLDCDPGLLRATMVLGFGEVHPDSRLLKAAWRFSRSRRYVGRLKHASNEAEVATV